MLRPLKGTMSAGCLIVFRNGTYPLKKISPVRTLPVFVTAQSLQINRHHATASHR
jgi:hypothetical protein